MHKCNSIALRKTKIVYHFGLSECNRVNINLQFNKCDEHLKQNAKNSETVYDT